MFLWINGIIIFKKQDGEEIKIFYNFWESLSKPEKLIALGLIGAGVAAVTKALWAIYKHFWGKPPEPVEISNTTATQKASSAGMNIQHTGDGAINVTTHQTPPTHPQPKPPNSLPLLASLIVGRDDDIKNLKKRLGIPVDGQPPEPMRPLTVIRGLPGVGKSTVVFALAHDAEITKTAFPDGLLWMSLGQNPKLLDDLASWGRQLGANDLLKAKDIEDASGMLRGILDDKRFLLIVDDVWEAGHGQAFKVGGSECAMLITTRESGIANALADTNDVYHLNVLENDKALELFKDIVPSVVGKYLVQSHDLLKELDNLPLSIRVAGQLLKVEAERYDVTDLLADIIEGKKLLAAPAPADLADLTDMETGTIPSVAVLLAKSTDRLDAETRERFALLGPFAPKPAIIDMDDLQIIWDVEDPKPTASELAERGLLEPLGNGRFQMHASLSRYAQSFLLSSDDNKAYLKHAQLFEDKLAVANKLYNQGGEAIQQGLELFDINWENIRLGQAWAVKNSEKDKKAAELCITYPDVGANLLSLRQHPDKRIDWLEAALNEARRQNNKKYEAIHSGNLGLVYEACGDLDRAEEMHRKALKIHEDLGSRAGMASNYTNLGIVYYARGELEKAEDIQLKSLEINEELGNKLGMANNYTNLKNVYGARGELEKAEDMQLKSLEINEELGNRKGMAVDCANLGNVYFIRGDLRGAEDMHLKSLEINEELGNKLGMANNYTNLGNVYGERGELEKAEDMQLKSLEINEELGRKRGMADTYANLGSVYFIRGDLDTAKDLYLNALELHKGLGNKEGMAANYGNLGLVYEACGDLDRAKEMWRKSLALYQEIGNLPMVEKVQELLDKLKQTQ